MKSLAKDTFAAISIAFFIVHPTFLLTSIDEFSKPQQAYASIGLLIVSGLFAIAYSLENKK